ncbi:hypothetical protein OCU04_007130 [Sclerotinia nivalis]|uniref:DUF7924 domain-containing protein n=1 Tax=Sclerotinia nivalis TaxID=352851 RepID=A0A9X0AL64_9HELO|nr:hypothetical protein OCU04_007130 [Sclerotinia nivalis]
MAAHTLKRDLQKVGWESRSPQSSPRKSARLEKMSSPQERTASKDRNTKSKQSFPQERTVPADSNTESKQLPSPTSNRPDKKSPQAKDRKRKRAQENDGTSFTIAPFQKRLRTSRSGSPIEHTIPETIAVDISEEDIDPLEYWRRAFGWPKKYFEPESNMNLLARKKSSSSFHGKQSEFGSAITSTTPSDQKPRELKSASYQRSNYETLLSTKGSFMIKSDLGITDTSKTLCRTLLESEQSIPENTLFRDDLFEEACESVQARNEPMIVQHIAPLLCPSAQVLRIYGAKHLKVLNESLNEGWNSAIPFAGPRPQPDYSVGFGRSAFTNDQLEKLEPFVGGIMDNCTSYFMATWRMYLPFLTSEVKCGTAALDIADRQNAHSMTLAVRAMVELFRLVKREKELHREILAFSISHDHRSVRIYGHYPVIDDKNTTFYRHMIRTFDFTELDGKDKWTAYKFTKNVYDIWMPTHLERIRSAVDDLPSDLNFEISQQSELGEPGLSQGLEIHYVFEQTGNDVASSKEADSQASCVGSGQVSPNTSLSQGIDEGVFKKPKKRGRP